MTSLWERHTSKSSFACYTSTQITTTSYPPFPPPPPLHPKSNSRIHTLTAITPPPSPPPPQKKMTAFSITKVILFCENIYIFSPIGDLIICMTCNLPGFRSLIHCWGREGAIWVVWCATTERTLQCMWRGREGAVSRGGLSFIIDHTEEKGLGYGRAFGMRGGRWEVGIPA